MTYEKSEFELPKEYTSFIYLHTHLGDVGIVEAICAVWNKVNGWQDNSLRVKSVDEQLGQIILTGKCTDEKQAVMICKWLVSTHVSVKYEKTIMTISVEV